MSKKEAKKNETSETQTSDTPQNDVDTQPDADIQAGQDYEVVNASITEGGKRYYQGQKVTLPGERATARLKTGSIKAIVASMILMALMGVLLSSLAATSYKIQGRTDTTGTATRNPGRTPQLYTLDTACFGITSANALTLATPILQVIGAPALSDDDRFVAAVAMKTTAYTIAAASSADTLCRNVLITHAAGGTADTLGNAVIVGTDYNGAALTETITIGAGTTTAGTKAFKTVTSITTAGWVIDEVEGTADTIKFGTGNLVGLPKTFAAAGNVDLTTLGTAIIEATVTASSTAISACTVNASAGTYDGSKKLRVWIHR